MPTQILNAIRAYMHRDGAVVLPELELLLFIIGILVIDFWFAGKDKYWNPGLALAGTVFSGVTLWMLHSQIILTGFNQRVIIDSFSILFSALLLAATAMLILLSMNFPEITGTHPARFYALVLCACIGMLLMISAVDLVIIFLALEITAVSFYFLSALPDTRVESFTAVQNEAASPGISQTQIERPNPAAVKFVLWSAFGSAILAYAFSLLYALTGSTDIRQVGTMLGHRNNLVNVIVLSRQPGGRGAQMRQLLQERLPEAIHWHPFMLKSLPLLAFTFLCAALIIKTGAISLQYRRLDASAGGLPIVLNLYLAGAFLIASIGLLLRVSLTTFGDSQETWWYIAAFFSVAALVWGNVPALRETNLERILAFTSIAQVGYLLLGLVSANDNALTAMAFYLMTYLFLITGAFAMAIALRFTRTSELESLNSVDGLFQRSPLAAILLTVFLLSLAGLPATAGFLGKYYIVRSLIEAGHFALAWFAALAALPLAHCYLRLIVRVWRKSRQKTTAENLQPPCEQRAPSTLTLHSTSTALLGICLFVSLAAGLYPEPFTRLARYAFGQ